MGNLVPLSKYSVIGCLVAMVAAVTMEKQKKTMKPVLKKKNDTIYALNEGFSLFEGFL